MEYPPRLRTKKEENRYIFKFVNEHNKYLDYFKNVLDKKKIEINKMVSIELKKEQIKIIEKFEKLLKKAKNENII